MRTLLIILSCLLLVTPAAAAGDLSGDGWTPEMAQMLASEGWEQYVPKPLQPVVRYEIHFVELSGALLQNLSPQFSIRSGEASEVGWEVSWDAELLMTLAVDGPNSRFALEGAAGQGGAAAGYSSWLLTVGNEPLYVSLSETNLTRQEEGALFQIRITPMQIDPENQRIQTQIALKFQDDLGAASGVELISWVDGEARVPVAVVTKSERSPGSEQKRFFALFVSGFVVPPERIPGYASVVPIGSLVGMQQVFAKKAAETETLPSQWGAGLILDSRGMNGYLSGKYVSESSELAGKIWFGQEFGFNARARWLIHEHLALVAELEDREGGLLPLIRLGVGDEVWLTPHFKFTAALYALEIGTREPNEPPVAQMIKVEFGFAFEGETWSIAYHGALDLGALSHSVKSAISLDRACSLQMEYTFSEKEQHRISVGLSFSIF
ncbi:MAG TPA: hypothetical protein PKJ49_09105 [Limnochordia bacterium]|nr:hypothetical protein [Limnochordia bacterium]